MTPGNIIENSSPIAGAHASLFSEAVGSPAVGATAAVRAAYTLGATAADVTSGITDPDVPRNLTITGNAGGIAGDVVITGTDYEGVTLTETIALSGTSTVVGSKAFKTVTSINFPAKTNGSGDTVAIGTGAKLGLSRRLSRNTVLAAYLNGTKEGTAPTVAVSSSVIASNTVTLSSTLNGNAVIVDYYV